MTQVQAAVQTLAKRVLTHEAGESAAPDVLIEALGRVESRLRSRLAELIGLRGYTTLLARALRLAQSEVPALSHVTANVEDGGLKGLSGLHDFVSAASANVDAPGAVEAGLTAILAHTIGLLSIFIGEDLAFRLVREALPEVGHGQTMLEK